MFPKKKKKVKLKLNARDSRHTSIKFSKEVSDGLNSGPIQYRQLYELLGGPPFFFFFQPDHFSLLLTVVISSCLPLVTGFQLSSFRN